MPGARCARSRAWCVESTRVSHHGHTGYTRHSPRNGFNGFLRALPGDHACLPPSPARLLADLTPASERQDHTASPATSSALVLSAIGVHRIPPRVRDVRETPLLGNGTVRLSELIWVRRKRKYFRKNRKKDSTGEIAPAGLICPSGSLSAVAGSR